ncbi:MAG: DUF1800 domain-containing protein [Nitrospiraceae bacterium]
MALTFEESRHLLSRTGFGSSPKEIRRFMKLDREKAVEHILSTTAHQATTIPPNWINAPPPLGAELKHPSDSEKKAFKQARRQEGLALKEWWYREMIVTPSPFTERMTLFWHNHFTSSLQKVKWPQFLYHQNILFRRHALGSFHTLLTEIAKDPAMVLYLDTQTNHKGHPNENFARELFELFTLGEGHYTEQDIKQAARAFTGWHVDRQTGAFRFHAQRHDDGSKQVLGRSGHFNGDDILNIVLEQPATARYLVKKLWREFISDEPDPREVDRLAALFRQSNYHMKPLLDSLFMSSHFWDPAQRGALIKSPVELMVGTIRLFGIPLKEPLMLPRLGRRLGQDLFDPPNVKGWPGGARWITTNTLLDRWQVLQRALRGHDIAHTHGGPMGETHGAAWIESESVDVLQATLLPIQPVQPVSPHDERWRVVRHLALDPTYQLM